MRCHRAAAGLRVRHRPNDWATSRTFSLCLLILFGLSLSASSAPRKDAKRPSKSRPALVVLIGVDQLRADILQRYDVAFTGGFRRLQEEGFEFANTFVDHVPTNSMPGHATLATGMFPSHHGILDGGWIEFVDGRPRGMPSVEDPAFQIVGVPEARGASPYRFLTTGLADWIKAADSRAEVVGLGGEYGPILHLAKARGHAYWYSPSVGQFVTSTFYANAYPEWVQDFNDGDLKRMQQETTWNLSVPEKFRQLALQDDIKAEYDHVHTTFPHVLANETSLDDPKAPATLAEWFYFQPGIDEAILLLAQRAVANLQLGQRGVTDFLSLHLPAVDAVGHRYGPRSLEQLDNVLRLDKALGQFFAYLDERVGAGNYLVALSADHGVAEIPEEAAALGKAGRRITIKQMDEVFDAVAAYVAAHPEPTPARSEEIAKIVRRFDFVGGAVTRDELSRTTQTEGPVYLFKNSYHPDRYLSTLRSSHGSMGRFGIVGWLTEGSIPDEAPAVHGSPHLYDRQVPLFFMGTGVRPGKSPQRARTVDVAPTLAALAGVPAPSGLDGKPLLQPSAGKQRRRVVYSFDDKKI